MQKRGLVLFAIAVILLIILVPVSDALPPGGVIQCAWYMNSNAVYISGYGMVCAYTNLDGCMDCWNNNTGSHCTVGGMNFCMP